MSESYEPVTMSDVTGATAMNIADMDASVAAMTLKTKEEIFDDYQKAVQHPASQLTPWVIKSNKADDLILGKASQPGNFMKTILAQEEFKDLTPDKVPMKVYEEVALYNLENPNWNSDEPLFVVGKLYMGEFKQHAPRAYKNLYYSTKKEFGCHRCGVNARQLSTVVVPAQDGSNQLEAALCHPKNITCEVPEKAKELHKISTNLISAPGVVLNYMLPNTNNLLLNYWMDGTDADGKPLYHYSVNIKNHGELSHADTKKQMLNNVLLKRAGEMRGLFVKITQDWSSIEVAETVIQRFCDIRDILNTVHYGTEHQGYAVNWLIDLLQMIKIAAWKNVVPDMSEKPLQSAYGLFSFEMLSDVVKHTITIMAIVTGRISVGENELYPVLIAYHQVNGTLLNIAKNARSKAGCKKMLAEMLDPSNYKRVKSEKPMNSHQIREATNAFGHDMQPKIMGLRWALKNYYINKLNRNGEQMVWIAPDVYKQLMNTESGADASRRTTTSWLDDAAAKAKKPLKYAQAWSDNGCHGGGVKYTYNTPADMLKAVERGDKVYLSIDGMTPVVTTTITPNDPSLFTTYKQGATNETVHNWSFFNHGAPQKTKNLNSRQWLRVLAGIKNKTTANANYVYIVDMPNAVTLSYKSSADKTWKPFTDELCKYKGTPFGEWCLASHALRKYRTSWSTYYNSPQALPAPCDDDDIPVYGYGTSRDNNNKCHTAIRFAVNPITMHNTHSSTLYEHQIGVPKIRVHSFD